MNTQKGNNNPYNQDNEVTWLDWDLLAHNQEIFRFFKNMIAFRKAHPSISRSRFWREDVRWYGIGWNPDFSDSSKHLAFCLHGGSVGDNNIYVMINAHPQSSEFRIQKPGPWLRVADTNLPSPDDFCEPGNESRVASQCYQVSGRSVVVLVRMVRTSMIETTSERR
jgi:glycogen operon protein